MDFFLASPPLSIPLSFFPFLSQCSQVLPQTCYVAEDDLALRILLPLPSAHWNYRRGLQKLLFPVFLVSSKPEAQWWDIILHSHCVTRVPGDPTPPSNLLCLLRVSRTMTTLYLFWLYQSLYCMLGCTPGLLGLPTGSGLKDKKYWKGTGNPGKEDRVPDPIPHKA